MDIYVGNLSTEIKEDELQAVFAKFGKVQSATILKDKFTNLSKGFGFIGMSSAVEGQAAIDGLNETELKGQTISVAESKPKPGRAEKKKKGRGGKGRKGRANSEGKQRHRK